MEKGDGKKESKKNKKPRGVTTATTKKVFGGQNRGAGAEKRGEDGGDKHTHLI